MLTVLHEHLNQVPGEYFCNLDGNGVRRDIEERPELSRGTVEFIAPQEYMVRPPQPPVYLFVIDVSYAAVQSGMVAVSCQTIRSCLDRLPGGSRTRIGFITFDATVHFYNLKSSLNAPQVLIVPDVNNMFLPLPDDMLVNLHESMELVASLLDKLPAMYEANKVSVCGA